MISFSLVLLLIISNKCSFSNQIFKFKSRKQTLNQIGGKARVGLDWLKRFYAFHDILRTSFEPFRFFKHFKKFDYFHLSQTVNNLGGFGVVESNGDWPKVFEQLKLDKPESLPMLSKDFKELRDHKDPGDSENEDNIRQIYPLLKKAYTELILPFENHIRFLNSVGVHNSESKLSECKVFSTSPQQPTFSSSSSSYHSSKPSPPVISSKETQVLIGITSHLLSRPKPKDINDPHRIHKSTPTATAMSASASTNNSQPKSTALQDVPATRLNRMRSTVQDKSVLPTKLSRQKSSRVMEKSSANSSKSLLDYSESDYYSLCELCDKPCVESKISCRNCKCEFHKDCISSRNDIFLYNNNNNNKDSTFTDNKRSKWTCPLCLIGSCGFGFEKGGEYTLSEFQRKANEFKNKFIKKRHLENLSQAELECMIEKLFWSYTTSLSDTITVEYGSDISSTTSGFPLSVQSVRNKYARDPWNLNNLPLHKDSLFSNLDSDISGMNIPWMYVGMSFSTFCWHSEDHYTYSVNYQHLGDTKTWYGVPGKDAELFESSMKDIVPELFEKQPDILSQLVTMMSPEALVQKGVHVYAIDQHPGEFVITLPKAYHSGFNHGFNMNEAVNFTPADWLPFGEESIKTYQLQHRAPVFSFDRLMVRTALLDIREKTANWFGPYFLKFVNQEIETRNQFLKNYPNVPTTTVRAEFSEEEYQCTVCHALPYLSRIVYFDSYFENQNQDQGTSSPLSRIFRDGDKENDTSSETFDENSSRKPSRPKTNALKLALGQIAKHEQDLDNAKSHNRHQPQHQNNSSTTNINESNYGSQNFCLQHVPKMKQNGHMELHIRYTNDELLDIYEQVKSRAR